MSSFDSDVMDDLYYDAAEGPARHHYDRYDDFGDEGDDEFLRHILGGMGRLLSGGGDAYDDFDGYDSYDEYDGYDDFADEGDDVMDAMEEAVVDALAADDTDEFFRRLVSGIRNVARGAARVARRAAPVIGRIARTVGPIASAIPLPWTQAIGRVANIAGRLMADGADEFEALDEMIDMTDYGDIDAAVPIIAGLTIRRTMPGVARLPRPERRRIVSSVAQATRTITRQQGPQAARAVPGVVQAVQTAVRQRRIPARTAPQAIARTAARVARSPQLTRRMARASTAVRPTAARTPARAGGSCPNCRRRQRYNLRGPVTLTVQGR